MKNNRKEIEFKEYSARHLFMIYEKKKKQIKKSCFVEIFLNKIYRFLNQWEEAQTNLPFRKCFLKIVLLSQ